ncbi:hypothetical protein LCGC14_1235870, partial [marine sediment metagenome]
LMSQRVHDREHRTMMVRTMAERALLIGDDGPGRFCLDYWPVGGAKTGSHGGSLFSRWPISSAAQRTPNLKRLSYPGPRGAIPSVKAMMFREGLQEAEARQVIELALREGKLPGELAKKCQKLLAGRMEFLRLYHTARPFLYAHGRGWQAMSKELFDLAGEATRGVAK